MSKFWSPKASSSSDTDDVDDGKDCKVEDQESGGYTAEETIKDAYEIVIHHYDHLALNPDRAWEVIKGTQVFVDPPIVSPQHHQRTSCLRIVCMSDTHGKHREVAIPNGDILIHGGDLTKTGEIGTIKDLSSLFGQQQERFEDIICIAGNHDLTFQPDHYERVCTQFHGKKKFDPTIARQSLKNCIYLEDESCTIKDDIEVYGSPWQPEFYNWAFNLNRGENLKDVWSKIPSSTDVLVTHGPPLGRGDLCAHGGRAGCYDLLQEIQNRPQPPRLHIFGHIHEGYGVTSNGTTLFVNASNLTFHYTANNRCIVIDLPFDKSQAAMVVQPECRINTRQDLLSWCEEEQYNLIYKYIQEASEEKVRTGNKLLDHDAYEDMCDELVLIRDKEARNELRVALSQLYAESF